MGWVICVDDVAPRPYHHVLLLLLLYVFVQRVEISGAQQGNSQFSSHLFWERSKGNRFSGDTLPTNTNCTGNCQRNLQILFAVAPTFGNSLHVGSNAITSNLWILKR